MRRIVLALALVAGGEAAGQVVTVDDFGPGCELLGKWADNRSNNFSAAGTFNNGYHYTSKHPPFQKTGKERATWTPNLPAAGRYRVEVSFRGGENRSSRVTYEVRHSGGTERKVVDQKAAGDGVQWEPLGTFEFAAGGQGSVALVSDGGGSASADAARFTLEGAGAGPAAPGGPTGADDVLGGSGSAGVRLNKGKPGTAVFTFEVDGKVQLGALLATYGPASLTVKLKSASGEEKEIASWKRANDVDDSPLQFEGQPVAESIVQVKPGDFSAVAVRREVEGKAGEQLILSLEGDFGAGEPFLEVSALSTGSTTSTTR